MSKRKPKYRLVLFNKRGGFTSIRYAVSFELWYGRTNFLSRKFLKSQNTVNKRIQYLESKVAEFEVLRLLALDELKYERELAKRKEKVRKQREFFRKQKLRREAELEEIELRRQIEEFNKDEIKRQVIEIRKEPTSEEFKLYNKIFEVQKEVSETEIVDFPKIVAKPPVTHPTVTIDDVLITPFKPKNEIYTKELVNKLIRDPLTNDLKNIVILNFSLPRKDYIQIDGTDMTDARNKLLAYFWPHLLEFFQGTKKSTDAYIFRIKFSWNRMDQDTGEVKNIYQGISIHRTRIDTPQKLLKIIGDTVLKFTGVDASTKKLHTRNYLEGHEPIWISGFTFESTSFELRKQL